MWMHGRNTILLSKYPSTKNKGGKKNTLEQINTGSEAEEWISELEDGMVEMTELEHNKEKRIKRNEDSLRDLQDNIKCNNIQIIGFPEEDDKRKGHGEILEIRVENLSKM